MGVYLNPDNTLFRNMVNTSIYVDHSMLINYVNEQLNTENNKICVSRPRRFGKSTDANMLVAYYSEDCDSTGLFDSLKIAKTSLYHTHLNTHQVVYLNMQTFLSETHEIQEMIQLINDSLTWELLLKYPHLLYFDRSKLSRVLSDIYNQVHRGFIFIIDEWDCVFRDQPRHFEAQKAYLDFLRNLLKDKPYVELAYMTGILPIKKYGTHSALNMFDEISMIHSGLLSEFMGFTEKEVEQLCDKFKVSYQDMKDWYDGYHIKNDLSVFSPRSVVAAIKNRQFANYWTSTETYEALKIYIDLNFQGLKDDIVKMLAGESVYVKTSSFQNDMTSFESKDDVLTLLIHLGYLGYNATDQSCSIPNKEVIDSFVNAIESSDWKETTMALMNSRALLEATWNKDEIAVAHYIEEAHLDTSILTYNNENALSYTISIAYFYARNDYMIIREMPSGEGFADLAFIPKGDVPAMIVELKWNQNVETAISQIKERKYPHALKSYNGNILIVGISYDRKSKKHECKIEEIKKS